MITIEESAVFPGDGITAPLSVVLRTKGDEFVVHYRNHQTGGYYQGTYTKNERSARKEYADRLAKLVHVHKSKPARYRSRRASDECLPPGCKVRGAALCPKCIALTRIGWV